MAAAPTITRLQDQYDVPTPTATEDQKVLRFDWATKLFVWIDQASQAELDAHAALTTGAHGGIVASSDFRLTDARTPTAHKTTHQPGGSDAMAVDAAAATGSLRTLGTGAAQAAAGNDSRLSDARTPTAHKSTHAIAGSDVLSPRDIGTAEVFNVKAAPYNAVGDGVTDDSAAIKAAVNAAAASGSTTKTRGVVFFPPGIYKLGTSASLTPNSGSNLRGIHFMGCGMNASVLRLAPSGSDVYFYDNVATPRSNFCSFQDLGFEGMDPNSFATYSDISANAKGFRLWATGATGSHEQGFRFTRCAFDLLDTHFETAGDQTTSEISWSQCRITRIKTDVYKLNNTQSVNHTFLGTDIEVIYGNVFNVGANGGGSIKMYGGSVIMQSDTGADTYFFKNTGSSGLNGFPFTFNGLRMELRGNFANLCNLATTTQIDLKFNDCHMLTTATSNLANFCKVGAYSTVMFRGVSWLEASTGLFQFHCTTAAQYGQSGTITFSRCPLPIDWSDRCTIDSFHGQIRAIDCYGSNVGAPSAGQHWAHDFDLHWNQATPGLYTAWAGAGGTLRSDGSPTDNNLRLKTAQMKLATEFWPGTTEHTLKLPKNAIIKAIHIRKPAAGADATVTTMRVGHSDKSFDHLLSNSAAMSTAQTGDVNDYYYHVGSGTNERTLRLYSSAVTTNTTQGGLCIVEYY